MTRLTICEVCGQRLDGATVEIQEGHVRARLVMEQLNKHDVEIEADFCEDCAEEKRLQFEASPFTDSLSYGPARTPPATSPLLEERPT